MPRYIDAENAISVLEILADKCADDKVFDQAISVLKDVPTENVVGVVRCKNCRNWNQSDIHSTIVPEVRKCMAMNVYTDPDQFCKYGERREDE